eukprot:7389355-Prymnesium_polylepis.1
MRRQLTRPFNNCHAQGCEICLNDNTNEEQACEQEKQAVTLKIQVAAVEETTKLEDEAAATEAAEGNCDAEIVAEKPMTNMTSPVKGVPCAAKPSELVPRRQARLASKGRPRLLNCVLSLALILMVLAGPVRATTPTYADDVSWASAWVDGGRHASNDPGCTRYQCTGQRSSCPVWTCMIRCPPAPPASPSPPSPPSL